MRKRKPRQLECGHDAPHHAGDLCKQCYAIRRYRPHPRPPRKVECGHDAPYFARGLCVACYKRKHPGRASPCAWCKREKVLYSHGLCSGCSYRRRTHPKQYCCQCGRKLPPQHRKRRCVACEELHATICCRGCGLEKPRESRGLCSACYYKDRRALQGRTPRHLMHGERAPGWRGGRKTYCVTCGRGAGWKTPSQIRNNKHGFRCRLHPYSPYSPFKEETHEHTGSSQVRSSVA